MPGGRGQKTVKQQQIETRTADNAAEKPSKALTALQKAVVELYGRGFARADVAKRLVDYLAPDHDGVKSEYRRLKTARSVLRRWEATPWFRDRLFQIAVIETDLSTRDIMRGVTARAKEGNVDAAKFAMEVASRYTPKGDPTPANVSVVFANLPRPQRREEHAAIEGEATEIEP